MKQPLDAVNIKKTIQSRNFLITLHTTLTLLQWGKNCQWRSKNKKIQILQHSKLSILKINLLKYLKRNSPSKRYLHDISNMSHILPILCIFGEMNTKLHLGLQAKCQFQLHDRAQIYVFLIYSVRVSHTKFQATENHHSQNESWKAQNNLPHW